MPLLDVVSVRKSCLTISGSNKDSVPTKFGADFSLWIAAFLYQFAKCLLQITPPAPRSAERGSAELTVEASRRSLLPLPFICGKLKAN